MEWGKIDECKVQALLFDTKYGNIYILDATSHVAEGITTLL